MNKKHCDEREWWVDTSEHVDDEWWMPWWWTCFWVCKQVCTLDNNSLKKKKKMATESGCFGCAVESNCWKRYQSISKKNSLHIPKLIKMSKFTCPILPWCLSMACWWSPISNMNIYLLNFYFFKPSKLDVPTATLHVHIHILPAENIYSLFKSLKSLAYDKNK